MIFGNEVTFLNFQLYLKIYIKNLIHKFLDLFTYNYLIIIGYRKKI